MRHADPASTAPRAAVLVHNDAENDARVLKESETLRRHGARVRIIAVERRLRGRTAGLTTLAPGLDRLRVPEFALDRIAPSLAARWRRSLGVGSGAATPSTSPSPAADPSAPIPQPAAAPASPTLRSRAAATARVGAERGFRWVSLLSYWARAARAAHEFRPDVIHANDANTLVPAAAVKLLSRGRVAIVYDSHELWRHRNVDRTPVIGPALDAVMEGLGIRAADAVLTVSPSIVHHLQRTYSLPVAPALVRNVPAAAPIPSTSDGVLRERAGLGEEDKVIAYGGRITAARGIEETIAALPHLPATVHFVLLGYGEDADLERVHRTAASAGVSERVHLVGAVAPDAVSRSLADGDVAVVHVRPVCLSYRYALPNKLFESIRAGLPVAVADLPDMRAVVEELGVGEVFTAEDPEDLAATLAAILADPEPYRERSRAAAAQLTWEHEAEAMIDRYRHLPTVGERLGSPVPADGEEAS